MTNLQELLRALVEHGVKFVIVGGVAGVAHGAARVTYDIDVVYGRDREDVRRLVAALTPYQPYLRGAPPGLPFRFDEATILHGLNFTLTTTAGDIDLLGEIVGGGRFEDLVPFAVHLTVFGLDCLCLGLDKLIEVKRAAGRPKDFEAIAELELLRDRPGRR